MRTSSTGLTGLQLGSTHGLGGQSSAPASQASTPSAANSKLAGYGAPGLLPCIRQPPMVPQLLGWPLACFGMDACSMKACSLASMPARDAAGVVRMTVTVPPVDCARNLLALHGHPLRAHPMQQLQLCTCRALRLAAVAPASCLAPLPAAVSHV